MYLRSLSLAWSVGLFALAIAGTSCNQSDDVIAASDVTPAPYGSPYDMLSQWHLFTNGPKQEPAERVIPYEVISPLFSDYDTKLRFFYIPEGGKIGYNADDVWDLPVGTILVKTFAYLADNRDPNSKLTLLETRLLRNEPAGWTANTYVWDADQKDATLALAGPIIPYTFISSEGKTVSEQWEVPSSQLCVHCHDNNGALTPIGWKTRELNRDHDYGFLTGPVNQIDEFAKRGLFKATLPAPSTRSALLDPYGPGDLDLRARSFLDGNCGHCHSPTAGLSSSSGLYLDYLSTDPANHVPSAQLGVCKEPTAGECGDNSYDIVPGDPTDSVLPCRIATTAPKMRMPPLGSYLINQEGLALAKSWIASLAPVNCTSN